MNRLEDLRIRMKDLILNTCNTIGCLNCPYKYTTGCASDDLQDEIIRLELEDENIISRS